MGYSTDVRIIVYGDPGKMQAMLTAQQLQHGFDPFAVNDLGDLRRYTIPHRVRLPGSGEPVWDDVIWDVLDLAYCGKWYDSDPDVNAWTRLMSDADNDFDLHYEICTIGEDYVENNSSENSFGFLRVTRSIDRRRATQTHRRDQTNR